MCRIDIIESYMEFRGGICVDVLVFGILFRFVCVIEICLV